MDFKRKSKPAKRVAAKLVSPTKISTQKNKLALVESQNVEKSRSLSERADLAEKVVLHHTKKHIVGRLDSLKFARNLVFVWLFLVATLILAVGFSQFFGRQSYSQTVFGSGGTYSEGIIGEFNNLNPIFAQTEAEKSFSRLAFSRIIKIDTSGNLKNELAKKIVVSKDLKKITIKLREDALWSDGEKITARDIEFTTKLMRNQSISPSQYSSWKNVKTNLEDEHTLTFELPNGTKTFIYSLDFPILPEHKLKNVLPENLREDKFSEEPITSGSFKFKLLQKTGEQKVIMLEANEKYFAGRPKLDRFEIRTYKDRNAIKDALISGEILASPDIKLEDFENEHFEKFEERRNNLNGGTFAFMNESDLVLKNEKVRRAVQSGINIEKVRKKLGEFNALDFPILPEFLADLKLESPKYDLEKANKLLDEEGWIKAKDGFRYKDKMKLSINLTTVKSSHLETIAQEFSAQLRSIGFEVNVLIVDQEDKSQNFIQAVLQPRSYGILIYEIALGADPDIYAFWHSSQATPAGFNLSNFKDDVADDILYSLRNQENTELRRAKYESFIKRWLRNAPAIGINRSQGTYINRKSVKPFEKNNVFVEKLDRYSDVIYWRAAKQDVYKTP